MKVTEKSLQREDHSQKSDSTKDVTATVLDKNNIRVVNQLLTILISCQKLEQQAEPRHY